MTRPSELPLADALTANDFLIGNDGDAPFGLKTRRFPRSVLEAFVQEVGDLRYYTELESDAALAGKAALSHTHAIGDLPVATSGTSNTTQLVRADDSRLSNARTPTAHTHAQSEVTDLVTDLAGKVPTTRTVAGKALSANVTLAKGDVGLGNVDNTSDAGKPVSTAQATAIALKADSSWTQAGTGAVARTVHDRLKDVVYVEDFGAVGNGTTDDRAAIQAAINAAATIGTGRGCKVHLRARAYKLSSGITLPSWVKLVGEGAGVTRLVPSFTTGDVVSIGNGSATVAEHVTLADLSIEPASPMTTGALIALKNHFWAVVKGIRLPINANINIRIDNGPTSYLAFFDDVFTATGTHGMQIGTGAGLDCQGVFITNSEFANSTVAGIEVLNCGGLMIDTSEFLTCQKALVTFPAAGRRIKGMMVSQCWFDTSHATGVEIVTNGGEVTDNLFDACWFSSAGNVDGTSSNVRVSPGTGLISGLQFGDCRSLGAKGHGYLVEGGVDLTWSNCQTFANSMAGSALYDGIVIGAGVSQWQIHGGQSGKGGTFWGLNQQRYGVNVLAGASDNYTIVNHDVRENVTGGIADGGTGTNKHIACCLGARTTNQGAGSIASGSQTAVISHGLSFTPATTDIIVVPVTQLSVSGLTQIWVSAASSTTFTVTANTPATATSFFSWSARVKGA